MDAAEIALSRQELSRLSVLERVQAGDLTQAQAAAALGLTTRQVRRLLGRLAAGGPAALRSARRGRKPNNWIVEARRLQVVELIRTLYPDFRPTLATEMLAQRHDLVISVETVRTIMREAGLWKSKRRTVRFHPPRQRRPRLGELIQIDGSPHDWFEGRAPRCTLLVFIDDATSRIQAARFVATETTFAYLELVGDYIRRHGIPQAFYSDRNSIFRASYHDAEQTKLTQFARALSELGIEGICANSPQAKGRVERANGVLQDRLVKMMRLSDIRSWEQGNAFLPAFLADHNRRFAQAPAEPEDAHAPLQEPQCLHAVLCWKETRKLSPQLTCQFRQNWLRITPLPHQERRMIGTRVELREYQDGGLEAWMGATQLEFDRLAVKPQTPIVESKAVRDHRPRKSTAHIPPKSHPWRSEYFDRPAQPNPSSGPDISALQG
jgi:transposase